SRVQLDARHVPPQLLEAVVLPRLGGEDVEDHVQVVGDDPAALGLAGDRRRQRALLLLEAAVHLVPDRLRLARVLPGREHEEVRVAAHGAHIEDEDVLRQLLLREAGDSAGVFDRCQWLVWFLVGVAISVAAVQAEVANRVGDRTRNEIVDRFSPRHAVANLARGDGWRGELERDDAVAVALAGGGRVARARADGEAYPAQHLVRLLPGREVRALVAADDEQRVAEASTADGV